jgi:hypothetical protein
MKTRLFMLMGILAIVSAIIIGPVAAATSGTAAVTGNPKSSVSITLNQSSLFLDLDPGASPATNTSLAIIGSTNTPFTITVKDSTSGRAGGDLGYMGNYTTSYQGSPLNTVLAAALTLTGTTNSSTTAVALSPPITDTPQTLYNGGQKTNTQYLFNTFSQVVSYNDARLPTGSVYRIDLEFDIAAV